MFSSVATWQFSGQAVEAAAKVLMQNGDALDALEKGIHTVETDVTISSIGRGGFLNADGQLELDAAIMDGDTLKNGAVMAVKGYEHPITIARAVMEKTRHNILVGAGAEKFARKVGIESADEDYLIPISIREHWLACKKKLIEEQGHDTIGMAVRDRNGRIVVGTSTSGAGGKLAGRVGDSPIIGSGFYCESGVGAAAGTGWGEDIMRTCCAFRCVELLRQGKSAREAVEETVLSAHNRLKAHGIKPDCIALVCMDKDGNVAGAANHKGFGYASYTETEGLKITEVTPVVDKDAE